MVTQFRSLPKDVWGVIIGFVSDKDLLPLRQVSKLFNFITNRDLFYRNSPLALQSQEQLLANGRTNEQLMLNQELLEDYIKKPNIPVKNIANAVRILAAKNKIKLTVDDNSFNLILSKIKLYCRKDKFKELADIGPNLSDSQIDTLLDHINSIPELGSLTLPFYIYLVTRCDNEKLSIIFENLFKRLKDRNANCFQLIIEAMVRTLPSHKIPIFINIFQKTLDPLNTIAYKTLLECITILIRKLDSAQINSIFYQILLNLPPHATQKSVHIYALRTLEKLSPWLNDKQISSLLDSLLMNSEFNPDCENAANILKQHFLQMSKSQLSTFVTLMIEEIRKPEIVNYMNSVLRLIAPLLTKEQIETIFDELKVDIQTRNIKFYRSLKLLFAISSQLDMVQIAEIFPHIIQFDSYKYESDSPMCIVILEQILAKLTLAQLSTLLNLNKGELRPVHRQILNILEHKFLETQSDEIFKMICGVLELEITHFYEIQVFNILNNLSSKLNPQQVEQVYELAARHLMSTKPIREAAKDLICHLVAIGRWSAEKLNNDEVKNAYGGTQLLYTSIWMEKLRQDKVNHSCGEFTDSPRFA